MASEVLFGLFGLGGWATSKQIRENLIKKSPNISALTDVMANIARHTTILKGKNKIVDVEKSLKEFKNLKRIYPTALGLLALGASAIEFAQQNSELAIGLLTFGLAHLFEVYLYRRRTTRYLHKA